jgi:hypothetical protein
MSNNNYIIGRRLEYDIMKVLNKYLPKTCTIHRTSGSHTGADVIVIQHRMACKIQAKSKKVSSGSLIAKNRDIMNRIISDIELLKLDKDHRPFNSRRIPDNIQVRYSSYNEAVDDVLDILRRAIFE